MRYVSYLRGVARGPHHEGLSRLVIEHARARQFYNLLQPAQKGRNANERDWENSGLGKFSVEKWDKIYRNYSKLKVNLRVKWQEFRVIWRRQELNWYKGRYDPTGFSNPACSFCLEESETENHLYLDCRVTNNFYSRALNWWKLFIGGNPPIRLKGPRVFGLENCPPDDLDNIFLRCCRYTIFKSRHRGPLISLDLFKKLVRDELSYKYRGKRYLSLLEKKEEVSAICWHSLAMEGCLL